jgi:hypothetical protein
MLTVRIPLHALHECTQYLAHNCQYPNREYYIQRWEDQYEISFNAKTPYLAFCSRWSRVII